VVLGLANCLEMDYKINSPYRRISSTYDVQAVMTNGTVQSELVARPQHGSSKIHRSSKVADKCVSTQEQPRPVRFFQLVNPSVYIACVLRNYPGICDKH
jgi:hypothetical protein